jgi:Translation initiation factor IF-2, N-terminal region
MTRVYEVAAQLGTDSKTVLALCHDLGISATSHMQGLTDDQVGMVRAAQDGPKATVTRFDKSTGKGKVEVTLSEGTKELSFDLRYTRLDDEKYVPIDAGNSVRVQLDKEAVVAIRSDRS